VYGKSHDEARRKLNAVLREVDLGRRVPDERLTVDRYLHDWLATTRSSLRPSTVRSYEGHIRLYLVPFLGSIPLARLGARQVEAMFAQLQVHGLSPSTIQRVRATLRVALGRAVKHGLVVQNAAQLASAPRTERRIVEPMPPDQARRLLEALRGHRWEALYVVALATGLRRGELLGLRWKDVDLDSGQITVRHALQRVDGKLTLVEPKTERSRRTVPLPASVGGVLRRHRTTQNEHRLLLGGTWQDLGFVFTTGHGTPLGGSNVTRAFQGLLDKAELPRVRFHDLRHACASFMLAQGAPMRVVMEQLGHSQIGLTMNTYTHVMDDALRAAAERMDTLFATDA
jgi:integrase